MTNEQIISDIARTIYSDSAIENMIREHGEILLHTANVWRARGYLVKRGEHGIATRLWRKRMGNSERAILNEQNNSEPPDNYNDYYLARSYLFTADQVIKNSINHCECLQESREI